MISAIVLAAGTSSRMGGPKPLAVVSGRPLLAHALDSVERSRVDHVVVVLGAEAERIRREVPMDSAIVVVNPDFASGMSTSLRLGIRSAPLHSEAYMIVLGDQPFVAPSTMDALIERRAQNGGKILVPTFQGRRGNPVLLDQSLVPELEQVRGDIGCRGLFKGHPDELVEVPVEDAGILLDVDTPEQLTLVRDALARGEALASLVREPSHEGHPGSATQTPHPRGTSPRRIDTMAAALDLRARNEPFVMATVVRATRPTSGKPGHRALILPNREMIGWVGGSCTESAVQTESASALRDGRPRLLRLTPTPGTAHEDGIVEYYMECHSGGSMDIYLEPNLPKPELLIVGDSPIAEALSGFGRLLGYRVVLAAPHATKEQHPDADEVLGDLKLLVGLAKPETVVVVATMGKYDETALVDLAPSHPLYVGLVASRKRAAGVFEGLQQSGVPRDAVERIHSPAGLDLAAETPEEIALSILAEVVQVRRSKAAQPAPMPESMASHLGSRHVDPVCGMDVDPFSPLTAHHEGTTYYFCSEGCRKRFLASPDAFLG